MRPELRQKCVQNTAKEEMIRSAGEIKETFPERTARPALRQEKEQDSNKTPQHSEKIGGVS